MAKGNFFRTKREKTFLQMTVKKNVENNLNRLQVSYFYFVQSLVPYNSFNRLCCFFFIFYFFIGSAIAIVALLCSPFKIHCCNRIDGFMYALYSSVVNINFYFLVFFVDFVFFLILCSFVLLLSKIYCSHFFSLWFPNMLAFRLPVYVH